MMKAIRIVLWLMLMSPALFCQGFLGVNGTAIVDDAGQPYMLRGYGLGGWLVPEGYMLHTPGYGSPTDIRNKIADLLGEQDTEEFYRRYRANYVNEQDIQQIADWGFNSIRLPFHYDQFYDTATQTFRDLGFNIVDSLLSWCRPRGIYVILDMHCAPGGQNNGNISDSDGVLARL
ncbi:MAG TPA: cellulase family glycosylhydrolase, partial [Calditrichia bacterium]|nr:cellulase family glycosylhydrolase [Calditrichia bacterium]